MTKEAAQFAAILKGWGPSLQRAVAKANASRWPAGAPGSKGGQFAPAKGGGAAPFSSSKIGFKPSQLSLFSGMQEGVKAPQYGIGKPMQAGATKWLEPGEPAQPKPAPPGAKPHLKTDDYGKPVTINYPTKPSAPDTWKNPDATATFVPGGDTPASLNGVAMKPWTSAPKTINEWANVEGQRPELDADFPMQPMPGKSLGAGVIIQEPDGRLWLTKPTNHFGGYQQTFPKGTVENGLSLQASAIKEAYEETGLKVQITGVLGDYERTTSVARFYVARRVGGTPADMGWESQALRLAAPADLGKLLNMSVDKGILEDLRAEQFIKRAPLSLIRDHEVIEEEVARRGLAWLYKAGKPSGGKGGGKWEQQARWPAGSPLGGQWKAMGADGLTLPPAIAGGLTGKNPAYQKKANAVYALAQGGEFKGVLDQAITLEKKVLADNAAGKKSSHVKWNAQLSQYTSQLLKDMTAKPKAEASAAKLSGPEKLSDFTYAGPKPGGSNPGGIYTDTSGDKWLVKGNSQIGNESGLYSEKLMAQAAAVNGPYTLKDSEDRAKNEVLASKLMAAAGIPGPEIKLVNLEGKHDGSDLGVAVKWIDGLSKLNPGNAAHVAAIQSQFAVHAWLGNYDVLGLKYDNTSIKDGKAINVDPGGALLFRGQGLKKPDFSANASDWETMRSTSSEQKSIFGKMSASQLQESAKQLSTISDETIKKLVDAHGPGDAKAKAELAQTLIARRDNIMLKAGLVVNMKMGPSVLAEPAPPPEPPKIADAVAAPAGTAPPTGLQKPVFNANIGNSDQYYAGLADKAEAFHAAGDLAALKAMVNAKKNPGTWGNKTVNSQKIVAFHSALVADLEGKKQDAIAQVATGVSTVTDAKGQAWQATDGVLNPVAPAAPAVKEAPAPAKKLSKDEVTAIADQFHPMPMSNAAYAASVFAMEGNAAKVKAFKPQTPSEKNFKTHLLDAMKGRIAAPSTAKPDTIPGFGAAMLAAEVAGSAAPPTMVLPAMPDFASYYTTSEKNKKAHNAKVDLIASLAKKGDVQGILALNYGSNTYSKQQVDLANNVLAALGSQHKVSKQQAANSHPALVGGTAQNITPPTPVVGTTPSAPSKGEASKNTSAQDDHSWVGLKPGQKIVESGDQFGVKWVKIANPAKGFSPADIPTPPDFFKNGSQGPDGTWKSSKKEVNEANNLATKQIYDAALASNGDTTKLDALTFYIAGGGEVPISQHKATAVKEYFDNVTAELKAQTRITYETKQSGSFSAGYSEVAASIAALHPAKAYAEFAAHSTRAADYLVLSKDAAAKLPVPASGQFKETSTSNADVKPFLAASKAAYAKLPQEQRSAFVAYTGSSYDNWNEALRKGTVTQFKGAMDMLEGFKAAAQDVPEGTVLWRGIGVGKSVYDSVAGGVIQDGSFQSSSYGAHPGGPGYGKQTWLRIHVTKGVKGIDATNFSIFGSGEREIIIQNNVRYAVLKVEQHSNFKDSNGKSHGNKTIVDVIALPH